MRGVEGGQVGSQLSVSDSKHQSFELFYIVKFYVQLCFKKQKNLKNKFGNQLTGLSLKVLFQF